MAEASDAEPGPARHSCAPAVPLEARTGQPTLTDAINAENGPRRMVYNLVAVMVHHGGPESGHYTTFRCVGDQRLWFSVSDADVCPVDDETVLRSEATLLCYEKNVS